MKQNPKCQFGIQGSVMGWDDPWHYRLCEKYMRTGERQYFPSQDPRPSPEQFIGFIKDLGVDFYVHQAMPEKNEINCFIENIETHDMPFMIGNEYGSINMVNKTECNRYDTPEENVDNAIKTGKFMGLIYDETEHLQLHPDIYADNPVLPPELKGKYYQWTPTAGKTAEDIESDLVDSVKQVKKKYTRGVDIFSEQIFPVMHHLLARGGMNPCPKVMKEEFQSVQISTALGAAKQYKRKLGICVDLWGPDVGEWFTRIWGFPGHSPAEFKSALEFSYLLGPDMMFVENADPLGKFDGKKFKKTEFAYVYEEFLKKFVPKNRLEYTHRDITPDIVVIRTDDTNWNRHGGFDNRGLFGSRHIYPDYKSNSTLDVFHLLSHRTVPRDGLTFYVPGFDFPAGNFKRDPENISELPIEKGVLGYEEKYSHKLFYPMNNTIVLDDTADEESIGDPGLIIVCGSKISDVTLKVVLKMAESKIRCIIANWLIPEEIFSEVKQCKNIHLTEDFLSDSTTEIINEFSGDKNIWRYRFGEYELQISDPMKDGLNLHHELLKR